MSNVVNSKVNVDFDFLKVGINRSVASRKGRGIGSGMGKTSCRGHKGHGARSGSHRVRTGQTDSAMLLPKRGFKSHKNTLELKLSGFISILNLGLITADKVNTEAILSIINLKSSAKYSGVKIIFDSKLTQFDKLNSKISIDGNIVSSGAKKILEDLGCNII